MKHSTRLKIFCPLLLPVVLTSIAPEILAQTADWKQKNDRGNRYEGRLEILVGRSELELLSFVGSLEEFKGDVILKVRFFLPTSTLVFIHGRELQERKQYWMESKPVKGLAQAWNEFGPWPTREVLSREEIPWSNLGVMIRLHEASTNGGELAPAFVYHATLPASVGQYRLYLRPSAMLKKVTHTLFRITDNRVHHDLNHRSP